MRHLIKSLIIIFFFLLFLQTSFALEAGIVNNSLVSTEKQIQLKASGISGSENVVVLRLEAESLTILSYTPPSYNDGWLVIIADCQNNQYFDSTHVCITLGKQNNIIKGESLGVLKVKLNQLTSGKLIKAVGNSYVDEKGVNKDEGILIDFAEITQQPQVIPGDQFISNGIFVGMIIIGLVVFLVIIFVNKRFFKHTKKVQLATSFIFIVVSVGFLVYTINKINSGNLQPANPNAAENLVCGSCTDGSKNVCCTGGTWEGQCGPGLPHSFEEGWYLCPNTNGGCPYINTQARVQPNVTTDWAQSITINQGVTFRIGAFRNDASVVCTDCQYDILVPGQTVSSYTCVSSGNGYNCLGQTVTASQSGQYTLKITSPQFVGNACQAQATVNVNAGTATTTPTPTLEVAVCGLLDTNGDTKFSAIDLSNFLRVYNKSCSDTAPTTGCKGKDTNIDGKVDAIDLAAALRKYNTPSCL